MTRVTPTGGAGLVGIAVPPGAAWRERADAGGSPRLHGPSSGSLRSDRGASFSPVDTTTTVALSTPKQTPLRPFPTLTRCFAASLSGVLVRLASLCSSWRCSAGSNCDRRPWAADTQRDRPVLSWSPRSCQLRKPHSPTLESSAGITTI